MQSILKLFLELKNQVSEIVDGYNISSIPSIVNHKIGCSFDGQPMFFIKCYDSNLEISLDCSLEQISVQYNRKCQLLINNKKFTEGFYTIISLKTDSIDLQEYFLDIVLLVVQKLPSEPNQMELRNEIDKLINLFSKFSKPPKKTIQGLWAELLVIEQSSNAEYLIKSWHKTPYDKFDFNDGIDKIEVKSTSKDRRIHSFSIHQLIPNESSSLIIASVFVIETGIGKNIIDLVESIKKKVTDKDLHFYIHEVLFQTLGNDFEKTFDVFFDYQFAIETLEFYDYFNVPRISLNMIPLEISNVRFDCDLTDITPIIDSETKSILHKSLINPTKAR